MEFESDERRMTMKRAFVVGRRQGGKTVLVLLNPAVEEMSGPWQVAAVVSR